MRKLEASYTVEAAFILPIVFALLYAIIFLGFYLHDHAVLEYCAWEGAFYGSGQIVQSQEAQIDAYIKERLQTRLFITELKESRITLQKNSVTVELSGEAAVPDFAEALLGYNQERGIVVRHTVSCPSAPEYVRRGLVISEQIKKLWDRDKTEEN